MSQLNLFDEFAGQQAIKQCSKCLERKSLALFPKRGNHCKECVKERAREFSRTPDQVQKRKEWRANRTAEQRELQRERNRIRYYNRTPEREKKDLERRNVRKGLDNKRARERRANESPDERIRRNQIQWMSRLKTVYGISPGILQTMYDDQGGKCYFCGSAKPLRGRGALAIDHDHDTRIVRGLLCNPCNANFLAPYEQLPKELQDSPRTNAYLLRGKSGDYIEDIRNRLSKAAGQPVSK